MQTPKLSAPFRDRFTTLFILKPYLIYLVALLNRSMYRFPKILATVINYREWDAMGRKMVHTRRKNGFNLSLEERGSEISNLDMQLHLI